MNEIEAILNHEFRCVSMFPLHAPDSFNAAVVLCAEDVEILGENKERIDVGLSIAKTQAKNRMIFLGTVCHIKALEAYVKEKKLDISLLFPTRRRHESSWTQIRGLADFLSKKKINNILIVSHAYHIPRIRRYCYQYMGDIQYDFYPVGKINDQLDLVDIEIKKIIRYAAKGDLPLLIEQQGQ